MDNTGSQPFPWFFRENKSMDNCEQSVFICSGWVTILGDIQYSKNVIWLHSMFYRRELDSAMCNTAQRLTSLSAHVSQRRVRRLRTVWHRRSYFFRKYVRQNEIFCNTISALVRFVRKKCLEFCDTAPLTYTYNMGAYMLYVYKSQYKY